MNDKAIFSVAIGSDMASPVTVTLTETCPADTGGPTTQLIPIDGGCITYEMPPGTKPGSVPSFGVGTGLGYVDRAELVAAVEQNEDQILCGAFAPPCVAAPET